MLRKQIRVVTDTYAGYEGQYRYVLLGIPVSLWFPAGCFNTWATMERAREHAEAYIGKEVWRGD